MEQNNTNNNLLVARALASSVKTLLGPHHSLKCCTSDGEAVICSSTSKLLQFIDIQHPAGFIINDACQGQCKKYRTNCKTLICMAGFWSKVAQELQDQGLPVPVIVQLFDDALEACEGICQQMSIPVIEALQSHQNSCLPARNSNTIVYDKDAITSGRASCCPGAKSSKLEKCDVIVDDYDHEHDNSDDDDDMSWYFDEHIPATDGYIPGTNNYTPMDYGHIPGVHEYIPGIINMEAMDESFAMAQLENVLPETENYYKMDRLSLEVSRSGFLTSSKENSEEVLLAAEYNRFEDDCVDSCGHVSKMTSRVDAEKPETFPKTMEKYVSSGDQKELCYGKNALNASESLQPVDETLLSGKEDEDEEEDEFEASFLEAVSIPAKENLQSYSLGFLHKKAQKKESENRGGKITKISLTEKPKDKFSFAVGDKLFTPDARGNENDTRQKKNLAKVHSGLESLEAMNKSRMNSRNCSSGYKERELLSLLSEKLQSKRKGVGKQVKLSEIYKGSRHFMSNSTETAISSAASSKNISSSKETERKTETCTLIRTNVHSTVRRDAAEKKDSIQSTPLRESFSTDTSERFSAGKTGLQSVTNTGQTGKSDSARSTRLKETLPTENTDRPITVLQAKGEMKFIDRNMQLFSKLGGRLSHGKEQEMKLAIEVINTLFRVSGKTLLEKFEIHLNLIHTELVLGPPSSFSQTVDGLLLESTAAFQGATINRIPTGSELFVALVNGDVTPEFRHAGLNNEIRIHRVIANTEDFKESVFNQKKHWYEQVVRNLSDHKIGVLVAKGAVQDSIIDYCSSRNIVVLQNIPHRKLQLLSFATGSILVTYLADLREKDVGRPVTIETWELGWKPSVVRQRKVENGDDSGIRGMESCQFVLVRDGNRGNTSCEDVNSPLQTVLLCSPCKDLLCDAEERFWNSIYHIKNALACGRVLPGAGAIEIACIRRLNELAGKQNKPKIPLFPLPGWLQESLELFRPLVYTAFAEGFKEFLGNVLHNSGRFITLHGVSTSLEQLINAGSYLDFLGSFQEEISENKRSELEIVAGITQDRAKTDSSNFPTCETTQNWTSSVNDPGNSGSSFLEADCVVWDDFAAKKEAWKRAVDIVRILLQSDMLVETGLESRKEADLF